MNRMFTVALLACTQLLYCPSSQAQQVGPAPAASVEQRLATIYNARGQYFNNLFSGYGSLMNGYGGVLNGQGGALNGAANLELARAQAFAISGNVYRDTLNAVANYKVMMAQALLLVSYAKLVDAQAERVLQEVRFWQTINARFRKEMRDLSKEERVQGMKIKAMSQLLGSARSLVTYGKTDGSVLSSFNRLLHKIELESQVSAMTTPVDPIEAKFFVKNKESAPDPVPAFEGGVLIGLIDFLDENDLSVKRGSPPHLALMDVFVIMNASAADVLLKIKSDLDILRDARMDFWENMARNISNLQPGMVSNLNGVRTL